ncbi:membrane protein [Arthrobacter phage Atuin]|nr:membrane protein [Arthrobacter phage Atuin]
MRKFIEALKAYPFETLFCWFMILVCAAISVAMWIIPFGFGYEWWMILINLMVTAACALGAWAFWNTYKDFTWSYYD